jgi:hypothetical protein
MQIGQIGVILKQIPERALEFFQTHRRIGLLYLGGSVLILVLAYAGVLLVQNHIRSSQTKAAAGELANSFKPLAIPPEELFLPREPDFLPDILLERPPREFWTAEDALPYWTDPLKDNPQVWRNRVERAVDNLMEDIP